MALCTPCLLAPAIAGGTGIIAFIKKKYMLLIGFVIGFIIFSMIYKKYYKNCKRNNNKKL